MPGVQLLELIHRGTAYLAERGVESPRLQVELLLAQTLHIPRLQLYLEFERAVSEAQVQALRDAVQRRGRREPLQHILGVAAFCGLDLEISPSALVPRPETEGLAERAWTWLRARARASAKPGPLTVLDWGTGSGCLAIAIARHTEGTRLTAIDASPEALALAARNAARHGCADRIQFLQGDGCAALAADTRFDLVVSNPPYIPSHEIPRLPPEVRDHDPRAALDGGSDGLGYYRRLAHELADRLLPGGAVVLEFGDGQGPGVTSILRERGWRVDETHRDLAGKERFLLATGPGDPPA